MPSAALSRSATAPVATMPSRLAASSTTTPTVRPTRSGMVFHTGLPSGIS